MRLHRKHLLVLGCLVGLSLSCQNTPPAQSGQPTAQATAPRALESISTAAPASSAPSPVAKAASPAAKTASPVSAPAAKVEPSGRVVYAVGDSISPAYMDPQEYSLSTTPYSYGYLIHDALVKHMPGQPYAPSLAESYELTPDSKSATFKLRDGVKFQNGDPVTADDVQFTYENYRGANAKILKDKLDRIEIVDSRTIRFVFKEPFLDFVTIYGSAASGAGWIVPAKYYQQVGPDGFKKAPIGAGPYKVVRQVTGSELELESFTGYWRQTPSVKTLLVKTIPDATTRLAGVQTGEVDLAQSVPGQLVDTIRTDPNMKLVVTFGASIHFLEFPGFEQADNRFNDKRVRDAISLALNRQALSDSETGGLAPPAGNWIPEDWPGSLKAPVPPYDLAKAKQLMAEAGYPDGFDAEQLTPPTPAFATIGERVLTQLREIGLRARLNSLDLSGFTVALLKNQTPDRLRGMVLEVVGGAGDAAGRIESSAICNGVRSPKCIPEVEEKFQRYKSSSDAKERAQLVEEIQRYLLDKTILVPIYRTVFFHAQSARIANDPKEIWGAVPQFSYVAPYEDIRLKQ